MKFLIGMNLSPRWTEVLSSAGHPSQHWSEIGPPDAADLTMMLFARDHGMCVITHDLDFGTILALTNWDRPSVIQIRADDTSPEAIGQVLLRALSQCKSEIEDGALLTIEPDKNRLRLLPFKIP